MSTILYSCWISLVGGVCALIHLAAVIFYEFFYRGRRFKTFNLLLVVGIASSAADLLLFGLDPDLFALEKKVRDSSTFEKISFTASNILAVIQLSAYISYVYIRALPVLRVSGDAGTRKENNMKRAIISSVFFMNVSWVVAVIARFLAGPDNDLLDTSGLILLLGGAIILSLDVFYLYDFRRNFQSVKQSKEMLIISTYTSRSIFLNFGVFVAAALMIVMPADDTWYPLYNLVLETFKWLVFVVLSWMKVSLDRLQARKDHSLGKSLSRETATGSKSFPNTAIRET